MLSVMYGLKGAGPGLCTVVPNVKNPPKVISRDFPSWKFLQILRTSVSGCLNYTFKICQTVAGTSMIRQFHEFFWISFLADFCYLSQLYAIAAAACFGLLILHWSVRAPPCSSRCFPWFDPQGRVPKEGGKVLPTTTYYVQQSGRALYTWTGTCSSRVFLFSPREIGVKNCAHYLY